MHDDALKNLWRTQSIEPAPPLPDAEQLAAMKSRLGSLDRTLFWRDCRENIAAVFVIVIFGIYFFLFPSLLARMGSLIVILSSVLVMAYPAWRKRRVPPAAPDASLMENLQWELRKVEVEIELLRSVHWWYILPGAVGVVLFVAGLHTSILWTILFTIFVLALDVFIYWMNQVACDKRLVPFRQELESLIHVDGAAPASREKRKPGQGILLTLLAGFIGLACLWAWLDIKEPLPPDFANVSAFEESDIARIDSWLEAQVARSKIPSLSVAIVSDGRIVYERAFGFADLQAAQKATPETSYHVASVTKVFTTSLAVLLDAQGVIDLDQPVAKYLPEGVSISTRPEAGATITLRQLASHTSSLPRGIPGPVQSIEGRYALEPQRLYGHLAGIELAYEPGTDELYSNLGMGLLGHALERAAGKPFSQLIEEMLCQPLGLEKTAIHADDNFQVATGYSSTLPRRPEEHSYERRLAASGGLIASAPDLARFLAAQMETGFFTAEMLAELHTPVTLADGSAARRTLGWRVRHNDLAGTLLSKNGGRNNASAWIGFAPEHEVGVAVVSNCGEPSVDPIGVWLLERSVPSAHGTATQNDSSEGSLIDNDADANHGPPTQHSDPMLQILESIRVEHKFPALAAAVVVDGKLVAANAVGFRRHGGSEAATIDDKFHLGSVTKSMTATIAAMLVEQGKISWSTTIGESFRELGDELHPGYRAATLEELLAHRGGAPATPPRALWIQAWEASGSPEKQRREFVEGTLARKPEAEPGTKHIYSNQGYAIAGVMLENAAGKSWEELMKSLLFEPLGMDSAGFGAPATPGEVDQPWGHTKRLFGGIKSVPPGPRADNPPAIAPAGRVHCSLPDLAQYVIFHLAGEQNGSDLLQAASFKKLHASAGDDYALGWVVLERDWAGGRALMHNGSNTMFYVVIWMAPERNSAVLVATNIGVDAAFAGCNEVAEKLIQQFFPK